MFQADLLQVLRDFQIGTPTDYYKLPPGRKTYFIRRLYKAFVDNEDQAFRDLASAGGVRFHFASSGDLTSNHTNMPTNAFLKKLCFYSNRTLISFPFKEITRAAMSRAMKGVEAKAWRDSTKRDNHPIIFGDITSYRVGGMGFVAMRNGRGYSIDPAAFEDFLTIVGQLKPAIDADLTYLLPAFPDRTREFRRLTAKLTSANFELPELKRQFLEEELESPSQYRFEGDLLNLYLPYFTGIPLERILEIRGRQLDMYNAFQRYMENLLYGMSQEDTETKFLGVLREIDIGIRELERKFKSVKTEYGRKDVYMGIGILCTGLALFASFEWGKEIAQLVAGATGTATGMQFFSSRGEKSKAVESLADDRFYLPWLIHKEAPPLAEFSSRLSRQSPSQG